MTINLFLKIKPIKVLAKFYDGDTSYLEYEFTESDTVRIIFKNDIASEIQEGRNKRGVFEKICKNIEMLKAAQIYWNNNGYDKTIKYS